MILAKRKLAGMGGPCQLTRVEFDYKLRASGVNAGSGAMIALQYVRHVSKLATQFQVKSLRSNSLAQHFSARGFNNGLRRRSFAAGGD
jgi:hypothetical protein